MTDPERPVTATAEGATTPTPDQLGEAAHRAALAGLPSMGPTRLAALLRRWSAAEAWSEVRSGRLLQATEVLAQFHGNTVELVQKWQRAARGIDVSAVWHQHVVAGITVTAPGHAGHPVRLVDDPEPPSVLFRVGAANAFEGPSVAIVGTRRCTRYGHDVARDLARDLAAAGVTVVSGLALGVDAAAHEGALDVDGAPPVAVVATGLDVVYPKRNRALWERVAAAGALFSEAPLGIGPEAWRFPARNRIIAGLADVVIVVESHTRGGSLYTVEEAMTRDLPVLAVPGPIRSAASAGTNRLLADGAMPLCSVDDVFVALGLVRDGVAADRGALAATDADPDQQSVLDAIGWEPASLDRLALATGLDIGDLSLAIERLVAVGRLEQRGAWLERVSRS